MELNRLLKKKQKAIEENNKQNEAEACGKLGKFYLNENQYSKALTEFHQESELYENLNRKMDYARANRMIGEVYMMQGKYKDALKHEDIYLTTAKAENDLVEIQRAYATVGRCFLMKAEENENECDGNDDFKSAEKAFLKSLIICKDLSNVVSKFELADMQARLYLNLGVTKEHISLYTEAMDYYKTALKIAKSNDIYELQHRCLMCLGLCYTTKNDDISNAMHAFNKALEIAKRIDGKNEKMCETLFIKSDVLIKNGDFQSAKQVLKKAYKIKTPIKADMEIIQKNLKVVHALCKYEDDLVTTDSYDYETRKNLFEKLGDGSCKLKNYTKAIDFYQKMLEAAELNGETGKKLIPIYVSLYQTYIDMKDYEKALKFLRMEYELIQDEPKEASTTLMSMGNLLHLAKKDFWEVDGTYRKALTEARKSDDLSLEKVALKKLIALCREKNMISLAEILEQEAMEKDIDLTNDVSEDIESSEDILDEIDTNGLEFELSTDADSTDDEQKLTPKTNATNVGRKKRSITVKKNAKGETKLHEACISGNYQLAKMLIDQGHAINVRDNAGWLPLHEASNHGHRDIVELLLDNGAQSSINDKGGTNCDGISPLYDAASNGHLSIVQLLLERGAKSTIKTDGNQSPLDALLGWRERVKLNDTEKEFYDDIKKRLVEQCEKVGIDTNKNTISSASSGYYSAKSKTSQASQRQNMRFNTNFSDDTDDGDDDDEENRIEEHKENDDNTIKRNARHEYKNVMEKLKYPHKDMVNKYESNDRSAYESTKKRSAYLNAQEIQVDDWLDDDLGPLRKKQKFFNENTLKSPRDDTSITNVTVESPRKWNLSRKSSSNLFPSDVEDEIENFSDAMDAFDMMMNANESNSDNKRKTRKNSISKGQRRSSNQASLLEAGFSRFVESVESSSRKSYTSPIKAPINSNNSNTSINENLNRSNHVEKQTIIKVQIDEEKIIVPINKDVANDLKISWLIEESSRRYYCLKGIRPELKLKTADGATLIDTDPLNLILCLTEENMIFSEILDWKLPSLSNRYLEACSEYKCGVDREINDIMDVNRAGINIDLSNLNLQPSNVRPILKALQHQNCLAHLDLSCNFIRDEGIKYLSQTLITLKHLKLLDLSGNAISESGVEYLCSMLAKSSSPVEIKSFKINFNPIKSTSLKHLSELCRTKSITTLSLVSCELVSETEMEILNIKEFDISYNNFNIIGLRSILGRLCPTIIEKLHLERCTIELNIGETIVEFITSGCYNTLKDVNLSGLKLNENEILDILRCLQRCENLQHLNLSHQRDLTFLTFKYILYSMNNKRLKVNLIGCHNLYNLSSIFNINQNIDEPSQLYPCHVQLSVKNTSNEADKNVYVSRMREIWMNITGNRGNFHYEKNILNLMSVEHDEVAVFM